MKRLISLLCLALALSAALSGCFGVTYAPTVPSGPTGAGSSAPTEKATEPSTEPVEPSTEPTEEPTVPTEEPTEPTYSQEALLALENENKGYGPGLASGGNPPSGAVGYQEKYGEYGAYFYHPDSESIFLTFDCGYEYSYKDQNGKTVRVTEQILDVLKEKNVKAVFFVTMYYCTSNPDLVQRMVDEGHTVGNHTNNHKNLPSLSLEDMQYEVMSLHDYVKEHFGCTMTLLRPPEGAFSTRTLAHAHNLGYTSVDWSVAHVDWDPDNQPDPAKSLSALLSRSHPGAIYLLHAVSTTNASILGDLIDGLQAQGYRLELLTK